MARAPIEPALEPSGRPTAALDVFRSLPMATFVDDVDYNYLQFVASGARTVLSDNFFDMGRTTSYGSGHYNGTSQCSFGSRLSMARRTRTLNLLGHRVCA